mmetsp:Transcript_8139/g.12483  ORF Transcript_8139/g.12483 Transcript_8139/m.12483 type:complete len:540 (-) Transcript_8139:111-1730(-)
MYVPGQQVPSYGGNAAPAPSSHTTTTNAGFWECPQCSWVNKTIHSSCKACGHQAPPGTLPQPQPQPHVPAVPPVVVPSYIPPSTTTTTTRPPSTSTGMPTAVHTQHAPSFSTTTTAGNSSHNTGAYVPVVVPPNTTPTTTNNTIIYTPPPATAPSHNNTTVTATAYVPPSAPLEPEGGIYQPPSAPTTTVTTTTTTPPPPPSILHTRDPFCVPAEVNAILNKCSADVAGSRMYVAHFPCNECAKVIIQSKLSEVIYMQHTSPNEDKYKASRILFEMAGIKTRQHIPEVPYVNLNFQSAMPSQEMAAAIPQEDDEREAAMIPKILNPEDNPKHDTKLKELLLREANYDPTQTPTTKRTNYLSWDDYFMAMAFLTARRSKDPNTQVGACIVDSDKRIIGVGYNGFPRYCSDDHLPWARDSSLPDLHKKYFYVVHAECNAILNKCSHSVKGATLYVALFPCHDCAKIIIQSGIAEVVYLSDQYHDTDSTRASRIMFQMAGVQLRQHIPHSHVVDIPLTASQRRLSSTEDHNDKDTTTTDDTK